MKYLLPAALLLLPVIAHAEAPAHIALSLKDHVFTPAEIHVPAGKPVIIDLMNNDATAEEFDSDDLHTEKVVTAHHKVEIRIPAQQPGHYKFEGEYHDKTAQGVLIAE